MKTFFKLLLLAGFVFLIAFFTSLWAVSLKKANHHLYTLSLTSPSVSSTTHPNTIIFDSPPPVRIRRINPSLPNNNQTAPSPEMVTGIDQSSSANWAGYIADNGVYTSVSGSWVEPDPSSNRQSLSTDATWVGIGGVTTNDLIQIGTQNIVNANGKIITTAFYETLPKIAHTIANFNVSPGDSITASLTETSPNTWALSIVNNTNNDSFNKTIYYDSSLSSAEWIEEDPSDGNGLIPLDNFGNVNFSNCQTTNGNQVENLATSNAQPMSMVSPYGQTLATVTNSSNSGFMVSEPDITSNYSQSTSSSSPFSDPYGASFYFGF